MTQIEVDFDVFKALTNLRESEHMTYNDVLRTVLKLGQANAASRPPSNGGWEVDGVVFPNGTQFRASFKGKIHLGFVSGDRLVVNDRTYGSPSAAGHAITGYAVNGWRFWDCKRPSDVGWSTIDTLRRR